MACYLTSMKEEDWFFKDDYGLNYMYGDVKFKKKTLLPWIIYMYFV